ncbi:NADH-quinone oxidoreductase subunit C [Cohnella sp. LGH]|uniref:NADH-quinone oxidoreductase subunit C n=1 Tax=Cohnella sp. LGH TaxID=1619153 RepID=UPI001ADC8936|nr:NADH-quinone oxidoreductase subunit C [Cohnella sp. LGH]QTH42369.1 NADH-quinone oxidoreductase subunit C [Cohnella sp. LGH]
MSEENKRDDDNTIENKSPEAEDVAAKPDDQPAEAAAAPPTVEDAAPAPAPERRKETDEEKAARRKATLEAREAAKVAAALAAAEAAKGGASAGPASAQPVAGDTQATPAAPASAAPAAGEGDASAPAPERRKETDEEKAARRKAALEAREAAKAAAAQAAAQGGAPATAAGGDGSPGGDAPPPKPPSPSQPRLDRVAAMLRELVAEDAVEEAYINEANDHLPTLVIKNDRWEQAARLFCDHAELDCKYLRNVSGVDYETHMEVVYYPWNMNAREGYCVKVRTDRDNPSVASATPIWETANWNEREIYDLLGVDFPGHPDLRRIMMPDDWVGHPLRKDYVPLDPEV